MCHRQVRAESGMHVMASVRAKDASATQEWRQADLQHLSEASAILQQRNPRESAG